MFSYAKEIWQNDSRNRRGSVTTPPVREPALPLAVEVPTTDLLRMYESMLRIRLVEERVADLVTSKEIRCPAHLYTGQEAIAVGVCSRLNRDDYVWGGHRSHGHYLAKGGDLPSMMAEMFGKITGCSGG